MVGIYNSDPVVFLPHLSSGYHCKRLISNPVYLLTSNWVVFVGQTPSPKNIVEA